MLGSLKRVLRQVQPDLLQAGPLQSCALLAALAGFHPLVSTSWGYDLLIDAGRSSWMRWATRYVLQRSDAFVGDCAAIKERAIAFGMNPERIVTFPWGIDLDHFRLTPKPSNATAAFTLLSTRSWEALYGVDVVARAFVAAVQNAPDQNFRLILLGNGSQSAVIRRIFENAGVSGLLKFPGQVSQDELPGLYAQADLYLSASHSDGTSISLLEALASGLPVAVSDIPGNREWITPGIHGWLFPDGDAQALSRCIQDAALQRARLPEMGRCARSLVEQRGDWHLNFPHLLEAYALAQSNRLPGAGQLPNR